jgi:CRP-like cAMP-binding protein
MHYIVPGAVNTQPRFSQGRPLLNPLAAKLQTYDVLSDEEIQILEGAVDRTQHFDAGQDLVRVHDQPTYSTALLEGWAARYKVLRNGRRQITGIHVPGDFIDLHSFLLHTMDHGIIALSPCWVVQVPHENLRKITETEPHLTRLLWMSTLVDGAAHREWLVAMGQTSASAHTAHLICELYIRLEAVGAASGYRFKFPMTQAQLGDALGLSAVHVNRSVQELRAMELITWQSGEVVIKDWERLVRVGHFDPTYIHHQREPR